MVNKTKLHYFSSFPGKSEETGFSQSSWWAQGKRSSNTFENVVLFVVALFWLVVPTFSCCDVKCSLAGLQVGEPMVSPGPSLPHAGVSLWSDLVALSATELLLLCPVRQQAPCLQPGRRESGGHECPCLVLMQSDSSLVCASVCRAHFWAGAAAGRPEVQAGLQPVSCCSFPTGGHLWAPQLHPGLLWPTELVTLSLVF